MSKKYSKNVKTSQIFKKCGEKQQIDTYKKRYSIRQVLPLVEPKLPLV